MVLIKNWLILNGKWQQIIRCGNYNIIPKRKNGIRKNGIRMSFIEIKAHAFLHGKKSALKGCSQQT